MKKKQSVSAAKKVAPKVTKKAVKKLAKKTTTKSLKTSKSANTTLLKKTSKPNSSKPNTVSRSAKVVVKKAKPAKVVNTKTAKVSGPIPYNHLTLEKKWQKFWAEHPKLNQAVDNDTKREKLFMLVEFPFPSGAGLHAGHVRSYTALDIIARKNRMLGKNVLYPIGWDAFGLPTENYAIKTGLQPAAVTKTNSENFEKQLKSLGFSFDWSRKVDTTDPEYYKWTQWIFLQFLEAGLAYRDKISINWCPKDKIGLANEEVVAGCCERCGTKVEKREKEQWMLAITKYADRLDKDLDKVDYPERVKTQQRNWIGKSEGAEIDFLIHIDGKTDQPVVWPDRPAPKVDKKITVFTTRPDTLFGVTYVVLAPEHTYVDDLKSDIKNWDEVVAYRKQVAVMDDAERTADNKEKTGVALQGVFAVNPATGEKVPVWIADYVLATYGTGAVMAVPAHDERDFAFAQAFKLPIKEVVIPRRIDETNPHVPGKQVVFRNIILGLVWNPRTKKYLGLKWKEQPWTTFIVGGIEDGELPETAARREILEETGFKNLKFKRIVSGPVQSEFFAAHKDVNRIAHSWHVLFELENDEREEISNEEKAKHEIIWLDEAEITRDRLAHSELDIILDGLKNGRKSYGGDGILIDSGEFSGTKSEIAGKLIAHAYGRAVAKYKLRDWVFSRQRYWGEPIPVVYCGCCFADPKINKNIPKEHISINFYRKDIWDALANGSKSIETRALNPEEKDRYFGDVKNGDIVKAVAKFKGARKGADIMYFKVEDARMYKTFDQLFADTHTLKRVYGNRPVPKTVSALKKHYGELAAGYADKIERNGLVAWSFKRLEQIVPLPQKDLPLTLPKVKKYEPTDNGDSPLAEISSWVNTKCPNCKNPARRETDTMPNWAGSSWYYLRYADPKNKKTFADPKKLAYWSPVDWYNGGMEHTTLHLLYSRFWHKFLFDRGHVPTPEPYAKRTSHGLIMADDGTKMSKSKGNVVNPDDIVKTYGADTLRLFEMFIGPFEQAVAWNSEGLIGPRRFIERVYKLADRVTRDTSVTLSKAGNTLLHRTIKKVGEDIDSLAMNTAVSTLMILINQLEKEVSIPLADFKIVNALLAPFVPHLAEELHERLGGKGSVGEQSWPSFDPSALVDDEAKVVIQINGKVRATITVGTETSKNESEVTKMALTLPEVTSRVGDKSPIKIVFIPGKLINLVYAGL